MGVLWADARLPLKLQLRAAEPGWSWSGGVALDAPGESILKMRHRSRGETQLLRLEVSASRAAAGGALAVLRPVQEGSSFAPYRCASPSVSLSRSAPARLKAQGQRIGCFTMSYLIEQPPAH